MVENLLIRSLGRHDGPPLATLLARIENFLPADREVAQELIDDALQSRNSGDYRVLVAVLDETVIGYVCYGPTPMTETTWDVYWLAADPTVRGRGIGRRLLHAAHEDILRQGGVTARIETSATEAYHGAASLYARIGYVLVSQIRDFYRAGDDLMTWICRLDEVQRT